jgi:HlyD family secretion protein
VISYGTVLSVDNHDLALRPGMTATASITTSNEQDVLMVPNPALRFRPAEAAQAKKGFSMFGSGRKGSGEQQEVTISRGANHTIYVLDTDGSLTEVAVRVGSTDGASTIVTGDGLESGMQVVTGELAPVK